MNKKKRLGQFYTPPKLAKAVVRSLKAPISSALELGVGNGQLGLAITSKFPDISYHGVDVDPDVIAECKGNLPSQRIEQLDVLSNYGINTLRSLPQVDAIIGNPPFIQFRSDPHHLELLEEIFPRLKLGNRALRAELVFLATSIATLKRGGEASFILPVTFFTSDVYLELRNHIVNNFSDISLLELPEKVFAGAEVSTCILSFKNKKTRERKVTLGQVDEKGTLINRLSVKKSNAVVRMDYNFHKLTQDFQISELDLDSSLRTIGASIKRGSASRAQLCADEIPYFHTTCFPKAQNEIYLEEEKVGSFRYAKSGDILTARVGSRCLERQVLVTSGRRTITDCIYRIQVPNELVDRVMGTLTSSFGSAWRRINAKGSCAKYITNRALMDMPLL